jgi:hypothetical protein
MKNAPVLLIVFASAAACATRGNVVVEHFGAMREVMAEGKTEPRTALAAWARPGYWGVGALAGLHGEVLIADGRVRLAFDRAANVTTGAGDAQATLLTVARVTAWHEVTLDAGADLEAVGRAVAELVPDALQPGARPVPFRIEGRFDALALHVARGACPHTATTPETAPDRWSSAAVAKVVGFFAPGREGEMTHHGTSIHAHAWGSAADAAFAVEFVMGHVDSLVCGEGARLFVPAR